MCIPNERTICCYWISSLAERQIDKHWACLAMAQANDWRKKPAYTCFVRRVSCVWVWHVMCRDRLCRIAGKWLIRQIQKCNKCGVSNKNDFLFVRFYFFFILCFPLDGKHSALDNQSNDSGEFLLHKKFDIFSLNVNSTSIRIEDCSRVCRAIVCCHYHIKTFPTRECQCLFVFR